MLNNLNNLNNYLFPKSSMYILYIKIKKLYTYLIILQTIQLVNNNNKCLLVILNSHLKKRKKLCMEKINVMISYIFMLKTIINSKC